jgi:N-acetyl sugar amidotransferase
MTQNDNGGERPYQACPRCIMDTVADRSIVFDEAGVCHHCRRYDSMLSTRVICGAAGRAVLSGLVENMKKAGRGRDYDCLIGVSGGVDSTYVAWLVTKLGLRPLAVHLDNGWNSELAVKNIERVLSKLGIDLYTYVIDWEEFRDLQISFLKASTPDGEIPSDHAIFALLWREAVKRGIKYIVSGMNFTTESIYVPDWAYGHSDWRYVKDVHRRFGSARLCTYPHFSLSYLLYANLVRRVRTVSILNNINYDKKEAMRVLQEELGWQYYGGKHHESVYTRFYQGYVLPKKFGIDKRYGHLSDLINAGQITREQALEEIKQPPYPEAQQQEDLAYVGKKLGLRGAAFDEIMALPVKSFRDYRNSFAMVNFLKSIANALRERGLYPR